MKTPNQEVRDKLIFSAGDPIFRKLATAQLLIILGMLLSPIIFIWWDYKVFLKVFGSLVFIMAILRLAAYITYKSVERNLRKSMPMFFDNFDK